MMANILQTLFVNDAINQLELVMDEGLFVAYMGYRLAYASTPLADSQSRDPHSRHRHDYPRDQYPVGIPPPSRTSLRALQYHSTAIRASSGSRFI